MSPEAYKRVESAAIAAEHGKEPHCHVAMADIYKEAGLLPRELHIPSGDRDWAATQGRSLIAEWVDGSGYFERIDSIEPGALIGFRLGHTLHHVSIALTGGRMVHVFDVHGVLIAPCIPAPWAKRIGAIWRIKE